MNKNKSLPAASSWVSQRDKFVLRLHPRSKLRGIRTQNKVKKEKDIYYEPEDDVLNIWFSRKKIDHAEETREGMIVHFTKEGEPVYIEVLFASKLIKDINRSLPEKLREEILAAAI